MALLCAALGNAGDLAAMVTAVSGSIDVLDTLAGVADEPYVIGMSLVVYITAWVERWSL